MSAARTAAALSLAGALRSLATTASTGARNVLPEHGAPWYAGAHATHAEHARSAGWRGYRRDQESDPRAGADEQEEGPVQEPSTDETDVAGSDTSLVIETAQDGTLVRLSGAIYDEGDIEQMDLAVTRATAGFTRSAAVDLSALEFLPSLAVGTLVALVRRVREGGGTLTLLAAPDTLSHRILSVVGIPPTAP